MAKRYIGDAVITLTVEHGGLASAPRAEYRATIRAGGHSYTTTIEPKSQRGNLAAPHALDNAAQALVEYVVDPGPFRTRLTKADSEAFARATRDARTIGGNYRVRRSAAQSAPARAKRNPARKPRAAKRGWARKTRR